MTRRTASLHLQAVLILDEVKRKEELTESQLQKFTILEKCSKQYEIFFQIFLSHRLLNIPHSPAESVKHECANDDSINGLNYFLNNDIIENQSAESLHKITELFKTLETEKNCRLQKLHQLLSHSLGKNDSAEDVLVQVT